MIGIVDYGVGNLYSVKNALDFLKCDSIISKNSDELYSCDRIILPGVGAFGDGMAHLQESKLDLFVKNFALTNKPILGICLGMQLLFEKSYEKGEHIGLGLIKGVVDKINVENLKIPHMGWNRLHISKNIPILKDINEKDYVYFVHSFMAYTEEKYINAYANYQVKIPAVVSKNNVFGCQFHPEKSDVVGLNILNNFINL